MGHNNTSSFPDPGNEVDNNNTAYNNDMCRIIGPQWVQKFWIKLLEVHRVNRIKHYPPDKSLSVYGTVCFVNTHPENSNLPGTIDLASTNL